MLRASALMRKCFNVSMFENSQTPFLRFQYCALEELLYQREWLAVSPFWPDAVQFVFNATLSSQYQHTRCVRSTPNRITTVCFSFSHSLRLCLCLLLFVFYLILVHLRFLVLACSLSFHYSVHHIHFIPQTPSVFIYFIYIYISFRFFRLRLFFSLGYFSPCVCVPRRCWCWCCYCRCFVAIFVDIGLCVDTKCFFVSGWQIAIVILFALLVLVLVLMLLLLLLLQIFRCIRLTVYCTASVHCFEVILCTELFMMAHDCRLLFPLFHSHSLALCFIKGMSDIFVFNVFG